MVALNPGKVSVHDIRSCDTEIAAQLRVLQSARR